jgi:peptidyl-prolyl cis-trans isomerase SurA
MKTYFPTLFFLSCVFSISLQHAVAGNQQSISIAQPTTNQSNKPKTGEGTQENTKELKQKSVQTVKPKGISKANEGRGATPVTAEILVDVNGQAITREDLNARINLAILSSGIANTPENQKLMAEQVLKAMIEAKVQLSVAKKYKLQVKEKEVQLALQRMAKDSQMTIEQLSAMFKEKGISIDAIKDNIRAQLAWSTYVRAAHSSSINVADKEVETKLQKFKDDENQDQYEVLEIFLRADSPDQLKSVEAQAKNLINQLKSGANFKMLARQFSSSASSANGGYLGWISQSPYMESIKTLEVGQASFPIQTNQGYYIFYVNDKKLKGQAAFGDSTVTFKQAFFKSTPGFKPEEDPYLGMKLEEISKCKSCADFEKVAKNNEARIETQEKKMNQLAPEQRQALRAMGTGVVTPPALTPEGVMVMMNCGYKEGEKAKPLTKEEMKSFLEDEKLSKVALRDLTRLITQAHIDIKIPSEFPGLAFMNKKRKSDSKDSVFSQNQESVPLQPKVKRVK